MSDQMDDASPPRSDHRAPYRRPTWFAQFRQQILSTNPLRVIGGTLLALLVIAASTSAVMFFAAAQLQSRIAELNLNGAPLTIWRVDAFREEFKEWTQDIRSLRDKIEDEQYEVIGKERGNLADAAKQSTDERLVALDARALQQKIMAAAVIATPADVAPPDAPSTITSIELLLSDGERYARFGDELVRIKKRYEENEAYRSHVKQKEADVIGHKTWIASLIEMRNERVQAATRLFGDKSTAIAPEMVERVVNITAELSALRDIWDGRIYHIALWTNDTLVLLLLISMGVLGSALNLLATFFAYDDDSLSFGEYPLRLAFGAVLAIVMFIIAKAGVPILADTTKIGGNAPLNPYFISLLAVISGLMSDRAMATIRNVASTLFQSVGGADFSQRYTRVDLNDGLQAAQRDENGLAELLGVSIDELKRLFSGNTAVSPDRQQLIAAYLGKKPRDLFSDLPAG
jgi:hypothetical protein